MQRITEAKNTENNYSEAQVMSKRKDNRMGDSKYGIKPSFILTVDESFTLLQDPMIISRVIFLDFLFGPYFQNFDKGRQ